MSSDGVGEGGKIGKYRDLISDFVNGRLPAQSFESQYLQAFKNDRDRAPRREFQVLEIFSSPPTTRLPTPSCAERWAAWMTTSCAHMPKIGTHR